MKKEEYSMFEIPIPNFVFEEMKGIYIMAGIECVGYKLPNNNKWNVKISRCSNCGECCRHPEVCPSLVEAKDGILCHCAEGIRRPFFCCKTDPKNIPSCTSKYEEV